MQEEIVAHLLLMKKQYVKITCDLPEDHIAVSWHPDLYSCFVLILKKSGLHLTQKSSSHLLSFIQVVLVLFFQNVTIIYQYKLPFVGQNCLTSLKTDVNWKYH